MFSSKGDNLKVLRVYILNCDYNNVVREYTAFKTFSSARAHITVTDIY